MLQLLLSVIIPVYKVEDYLEQCINSVLEQNLRDYEIILVDDGSPDRCPEICDQFAARIPEIQVIHQSNKGLSEARNTGIAAAHGKYIAFIDSDDWWNPKVRVEQILNQIQSAGDVDMFLFTSIDYIDGDGYYKRSEHNNLETIRTQKVEYYYQDLLLNGNLEVSACTKFIDKKFLISNNLFFRSGLLGEDNEWMIRVLRKLKRVQIINQPLYICRISRNSSITHQIKKKNIDDLLRIIEESLLYYRNETSSNVIKPLELCFCSYLWFSALGLSHKLTAKERRQLLPRFKSTVSVCKYSNSPKTKMAYSVQKLLGIRNTSFILGKYIQLRSGSTIRREKVDL